MATKANGDPLEGTLPAPSNYPNPVVNNVNMWPVDWAYGDGNKLIGADTTAPSAPGTVTASNIGATVVDLSWGASTDFRGVASYTVYNGATALTTVTATTAHITGLTTATQYTLTVKAKDAAGNESAGTNVTFTTA